MKVLQERIGRNNTQYIDSEAPQHVPGGGTMSITQMSLNALYELHNKAKKLVEQKVTVNCH